MPISGLVIRIEASRQQLIRTALATLPGLELQPLSTAEVLVATLESRDFAEEQVLTERIAAVAGVSHVALAYHNFEDLEAGAIA